MYDIIIIGGGPAGLSAAIYAARQGLNAVTVEKIAYGTGQIAESERVDNYPGLYGENGFDLGQRFRKHALDVGAELKDGEVVKISPASGGYAVKLVNGETLEAKTIIYAAGTTRRKLGVPGEAELTGSGVSYCAVCDAAFYKNKIAVVAGGGDTAFGDAEVLARHCEKVILIHRRDEFRASPLAVKKARENPKIEFVTSANILKINGESKVESVTVKQNGKTFEIACDGVFVAVGSTPNGELVKDLVQTDRSGYIIADESGKTSAEGIFAAGDVRTKRLRQVITAAADGANCVISAEEGIKRQ